MMRCVFLYLEGGREPEREQNKTLNRQSEFIRLEFSSETEEGVRRIGSENKKHWVVRTLD